MRSRLTVNPTQLTSDCAVEQRALPLRIASRSDFLFTPLRAAGMCVAPQIERTREKNRGENAAA
jgi:hypothetical protein